MQSSVRPRPPRWNRASGGATWVAICLAALALSAGCRKAAAPAPEEPDPWAPKPEVVPKYPDEKYGDAELAKNPRIQFLWSPVKGGKGKDTIWSMRLDGTDIRRTATPELLFSGEAKEIHYAVRSPDGRYVACSGSNADLDEIRFLVDLKEKKLQTMSRTDGRPYFTWTPDSRQVIFYGNAEFWQYDVPTGRLSQPPIIYSAGLVLVDGGKQFIALNNRRIEYYDRAGKLLRRIKHPFNVGQSHKMSADGQTFLLNIEAHSVFFRSDHPEKVLWRDGKFRDLSVFGPGGEVLYWFDGHQLVAFDMATGRDTPMAPFPGEIPFEPTLVSIRSAP
jgi:hypothetical protein